MDKYWETGQVGQWNLKSRETTMSRNKRCFHTWRVTQLIKLKQELHGWFFCWNNTETCKQICTNNMHHAFHISFTPVLLPSPVQTPVCHWLSPSIGQNWCPIDMHHHSVLQAQEKHSRLLLMCVCHIVQWVSDIMQSVQGHTTTNICCCVSKV